MKQSEKNWKVGEVVNLPKREKQLKKSGITTYTRFVTSRYVCIREATEGQRGILVKVLGKCFADDLMIVSGHPFCKDDRDELLEGVRYLSFPFPQTRDVQEVIDIVRENPDLINAFSSASMPAAFSASTASSAVRRVSSRACDALSRSFSAAERASFDAWTASSALLFAAAASCSFPAASSKPSLAAFVFSCRSEDAEVWTCASPSVSAA